MADLNIVYAPVVEREDPDIVLFRHCVGVEIFGACTGHWEDVYLPDELRAKIRELNQHVLDTGNAVKVPYTGTTSADRLAYLTQILQAVNNRVQFISDRTNALLENLKDTDSAAYDASLKLFTTALALVPVIGSVVSFVVGKNDAAKAIDSYKLQALIKSYASDLGQLATIRAQLLKEYQAATGTNTDPLSNASTPWPTWYYVVIAVTILLLVAYVRNRNLNK